MRVLVEYRFVVLDLNIEVLSKLVAAIVFDVWYRSWYSVGTMEYSVGTMGTWGTYRAERSIEVLCEHCG